MPKLPSCTGSGTAVGSSTCHRLCYLFISAERCLLASCNRGPAAAPPGTRHSMAAPAVDGPPVQRQSRRLCCNHQPGSLGHMAFIAAGNDLAIIQHKSACNVILHCYFPADALSAAFFYHLDLLTLHPRAGGTQVATYHWQLTPGPTSVCQHSQQQCCQHHLGLHRQLSALLEPC